MKSLGFHALAVIAIVAVCQFASDAQPQYRSAVPQVAVGIRPMYGYHPGYGYHPVGGYGYGAIPMTAAGSTGIGVGHAAQGIGEFLLDYQDAAEQYIKNQDLAAENYAKEKRIRDQFGAEYRQKQLEQFQQKQAAHTRALAHMSAPHRLTDEQFDRTHNIIHWPFVLRDPAFDAERLEIDKLYHVRTAQNSGEGSQNYAAIKEACDKMHADIKGQVRKGELSATDYITAKHFTESLCYEGRFAVKAQ